MDAFEIFGPALSLIASIIAFSGETKIVVGLKTKLTKHGKASIVFMILGLTITYLSVYNSNKLKNQELNKTRNSLIIITQQYSLLLKNDSLKTKVNDLLKIYISMIKQDISDTQRKKLEQDELNKRMATKVLIENAIAELNVIQDMLRFRNDEALDGFKTSTTFISGEYPHKELQEVMKCPLTESDRKLIKTIIEHVKIANETIGYCKISTGENKRINIDSLKRQNDKLRSNISELKYSLLKMII